VLLLACAGLLAHQVAVADVPATQTLGPLPSIYGARAPELALGSLSGGPLAAADREPAAQPGQLETTSLATPGGKSSHRAFLLSAILPGSGELYAGSRVKGAVFLGLEATAAGLWYSWNGTGNDLEDEFRAFADTHWDPHTYVTWRESSRAVRYNSFTHALPCSTQVAPAGGSLSGCGSSSKQQYYELLGKYDQFVAGWDDLVYVADQNPVQSTADFDSVESVQSANRVAYEGQRDDSNRYLKRATYALSLLLVNHVVSAIDAAATARSHPHGAAAATVDRRTRFAVDLGTGTDGGLYPVVLAYKPFD
jgi:hypothetical protein